MNSTFETWAEERGIELARIDVRDYREYFQQWQAECHFNEVCLKAWEGVDE